MKKISTILILLMVFAFLPTTTKVNASDDIVTTYLEDCIITETDTYRKVETTDGDVSYVSIYDKKTDSIETITYNSVGDIVDKEEYTLGELKRDGELAISPQNGIKQQEYSTYSIPYGTHYNTVTTMSGSGYTRRSNLNTFINKSVSSLPTSFLVYANSAESKSLQDRYFASVNKIKSLETYIGGIITASTFATAMGYIFRGSVKAETWAKVKAVILAGVTVTGTILYQLSVIYENLLNTRNTYIDLYRYRYTSGGGGGGGGGAF